MTNFSVLVTNDNVEVYLKWTEFKWKEVVSREVFTCLRVHGTLSSCLLLQGSEVLSCYTNRYSVENSYLEEKEDTCNALGELAENTR
jgi:hypothetical protein